MSAVDDPLDSLREIVAELRAEREPPWLTHLVALSNALETGDELPPEPDWMERAGRPILTLIQGGRDA